jgi:hypothetical protein
VAAALSLAWLFPRAYPLFPRDWEISKAEAEALALERLRDLGSLPERPYVVTQQEEAPALEYRLQRAMVSGDLGNLAASRLIQGLRTWEVTVFEPGARPAEWGFRARVSP